MRKLLISILVCLLLVGCVYVMVYGVDKIELKSFKGISEKNQELDERITSLSNLVSVTYQNTLSNLKRAANTLSDSKAEYENQAALSSYNSASYASQLEKYEIDFLWTKLGNYAREENVVIRIDVTSNEASASLYNLDFSVTGEYVNITDFIYDIENDSRLGFKIDDFKMQMSGNQLLATFTCKEIAMNVGQIDTTSEKDTANPQGQANNQNGNNAPDAQNANTTSSTNATTSNTNTNANTKNVTATYKGAADNTTANAPNSTGNTTNAN